MVYYYIYLSYGWKNWGAEGGYVTCPWSQSQVVAESEFELRFVWLQIPCSFHHNPAHSFFNEIQRPTLCLSASENPTSMRACSLPSFLDCQKYSLLSEYSGTCLTLENMWKQGKREEREKWKEGGREGFLRFLLIFFEHNFVLENTWFGDQETLLGFSMHHHKSLFPHLCKWR